MEKETFTEQKLPSYGGQALIEGVLMRGSRHAAAALAGTTPADIGLAEPIGDKILDRYYGGKK